MRELGTARARAGALGVAELLDDYPVRQMLFFISPRLIDLDSYLPTIMELKAQRPGWDFKVICFDKDNYNTIQNNPVLRSGLDKAAALYFCGTKPAASPLRRRIGGLVNFLRVSSWILRRKKPALFLAVPFTEFPYVLWYLLARSRSGNGFVLFKHRSTDEMHHLMWRARDLLEPKVRGLWSQLMGRDQDAIIHYHDQQKVMIEQLSAMGYIANTPRYNIGLPHGFSAWQRHIDEETEKQRRELVEQGIPADAELYGFFPGKPGSNEFLRGVGSIEHVFLKQMKALAKLRPNAYILIRPHPLAIHEEYVREGMRAFGNGQARISFAHPEVLLRLCRRCLFNNPTNLLFHCFPGHMVDCSDYPDDHYEEHGDISMAEGLGIVFVRPDRDNFYEKFREAIENDEPFREARNVGRLERIMESGKPRISSLLQLLDGGRHYQLSSGHISVDGAGSAMSTQPKFKDP